jgi:TonB family protein
MRIRLLFILALTCMLGTTFAAPNLEQTLNGQYHDKILALRHSFQSRSQEYANDGSPVRSAQEGPWTLYGSIVVKKIKVQENQLTIEGKRALYFFDSTGMRQFPDDRKHPAEDLKIVLHLQQPLASTDEAVAILGRVFALTNEDRVSSVPAYWQPHIAKLLGVQKPKNTGTEDATAAAHEGETGDEKVFKLGNIDKNHGPKPLYTPEPDFTEAARSRRFQGVAGLIVTIDSTGRVRNIRIAHALGMGLDESAITTVSSWRFAPAQIDARPVAVEVYIEVDFHLF